MFKYIVKRLLLSILILLGISIILYILIRLMPDDFVSKQIQNIVAGGSEVTQEMIDALYEAYGLNGTWAEGYINRLGNFVTGNWGDSFVYARPVADVIGQFMWISFGISAVSLVFQFIIAIPLGVTAATHQYGVVDYTVTVLVIIGISLPAFFFGKFLLTIFGKGYGGLEILPSSGLKDTTQTLTGFAKFVDLIYHLILPMFVLTILSVGGLMRHTRTNMLEVLNSDYIRTARAKGLSEKKVVYKHAFRNTMIPLVTMLAGTLPGLFGGAMITEQVFNLDGIGNKAYRAMIDGDIPFTMSYNMFISIMTVLGVLLSDLAYGLVDPRVKIGK